MELPFTLTEALIVTVTFILIAIGLCALWRGLNLYHGTNYNFFSECEKLPRREEINLPLTTSVKKEGNIKFFVRFTNHSTQTVEIEKPVGAAPNSWLSFQTAVKTAEETGLTVEEITLTLDDFNPGLLEVLSLTRKQVFDEDLGENYVD